jgi:hypothetical protein
MKNAIIIVAAIIILTAGAVIILTNIPSKFNPASSSVPTPTLTPQSMDEKRTQDMLNLRQLLEVYRLDKGSYPPTLYDLYTNPNLAPLDPETDRPYEYQVKDSGLDYQLCITYSEKPKECISARIPPKLPNDAD